MTLYKYTLKINTDLVFHSELFIYLRSFLTKIASETLHLELDPESVEYLIPNSGLVGFRFLVHETPEPHWVYHQSAIFLGAQFHTMLRLVGTRKALTSLKLCNFLPVSNLIDKAFFFLYAAAFPCLKFTISWT
ncbi:hypothetical protein ACTXT7_006942 [Hymenolepis weldensis]